MAGHTAACVTIFRIIIQLTLTVSKRLQRTATLEIMQHFAFVRKSGTDHKHAIKHL